MDDIPYASFLSPPLTTINLPSYRAGQIGIQMFSGIAVYMGNSALYAVVAVLLTLSAASLSAYAFARMRFIGKEVLFYLIQGLLMIPGVLTLAPSFVLMLEFNYGAQTAPEHILSVWVSLVDNARYALQAAPQTRINW
jgi:ABC-type glycerol-3-phosphate transport system permease component